MGNGALLSALNEKILSFEEHLALRQSVIPFYEAVLSPKTVVALVEIATSESWQSFSAEDKSKDRTTFIQHVEKFASTIPDLKCDIKEMITSSRGDKIIVRSELSGTPTSNLFGVPNSEKRKFSVMAIDIHTLEGVKLVSVHHAVDWLTATKTLSGQETIGQAVNHLSYTALEAQGENLQTRAEAIVRPFYDALTRPQDKDVETLVRGAITDNWLSFSDERVHKDSTAFINQVKGFGKLIPDLTWDVKEIIPSACGTKIVVRSVASGTPVGPLFGVENPGKKKFSIYAIDLHTVRGGKLARVYHVEDWRSALAQLKA